ncbi:MAG TPA: hypothetical protein VK917_00055, partial [Ilumatobacter sp.]|nr:hypothetical protein [Ilumatobacter sp.]
STVDDTTVDDTIGDTADTEPTTDETIDETMSTTADTTTTVATPTTVPETTTTVEATADTTEPPPPTDFGPAPTPPPLAYASGDVDLVEIDVATGAVTRTVTELFNGDGVFRGNLRLAPDGASIWFSEGYEDGWYGCESSVGSVGRVDVATGAIEIVGAGSGPDPSPDGAFVAYRSSQLCLPDPENPANWVLTPYDRVVVRDLAAGTPQEFVTNPAPTDYGSPSQVTWAGYAGDGGLLVLTADGQLRRIDTAGSTVLQDHPVVVSEVRGDPVGVTESALVTVDVGTEGSADLYAIDLASGGAVLLATSEGFLTAGVAANGAIVVAGFTDVTVEPGAPVTVLTAPDGGTFFDLDW